MDTGPNSASFPIATALRRALAGGYGLPQLRADLLAGLVVGIVALPLSMALAIAVGAPPQHGLYTAIVAGSTVAALGGSKFQVTGPTAAFIVILAPIVNQHGLSGLLTAGFMAGAMLFALGALRLGAFIRFIPYPVTTGFTTGIATVIATLQIKDLLGLDVAKMPDAYHEKWLALWEARGSFAPHELALALGTLGVLLAWPKLVPKIPAPLVAITLAAVGAFAVQSLVPGVVFDTIGSRFQTEIGGEIVRGIPRSPPLPALPWDTGLLPSFALIRSLFPAAFAIAALGAIESLLSAVIADGMTGDRHDPNAELVGQGIGNMIAPLFGGIAATGALARTATNVRSGAVSPIAAIVHSVVVLLAILLLAPAVAYVPMAALAALLLLVAYNMSEIRHFVHLMRISPKSDISVLLLCFTLTVFLDMVYAVSIGFALAALLFMRRMAEITESRVLLEGELGAARKAVPKGVLLYQIGGPLFFGAAQKALEALHASNNEGFKVLTLDLSRVPVIDATGLVALEEAIDGSLAAGKHVVLAGPLPKPDRLFERSGLLRKTNLHVAPEGLDAALRVAAELAGSPWDTIPPSPPRTAARSEPPR